MATATRSPDRWRLDYLPAAESAREIAPRTASVAADASTFSMIVKPRCQFLASTGSDHSCPAREPPRPMAYQSRRAIQAGSAASAERGPGRSGPEADHSP